MRAAVIRIEEMKDYKVLLPDYTIKNADRETLTSFLRDFKQFHTISLLKNGTLGTWREDDPVLEKARIYACITDEQTLTIYDFEPFLTVLKTNHDVRWVSASDYAKKHGKSVERVKTLCQAGRIAGAMKLTGRAWAIPEDSPYPMDERYRSGVYTGNWNKAL